MFAAAAATTIERAMQHETSNIALWPDHKRARHDPEWTWLGIICRLIQTVSLE